MLEEPLDHVHLRLRERRVEPHASHAGAVTRRRVDHVAARCAGRVRVVEDDPPRARRERLLELVRKRAKRPAALVAVEAEVAACAVLLRDTALSGTGDPHDEHDLGRARRRRGGADRARRNQTRSLAGAELERRGARGRARGLRPAGARDCDDVRAEAEQPRERDLGGCRAVRLRDLAEHLPAGEARRAARPAERRMRDQRDTRLGASLDQADAERPVVDHAQGNLHRGDRSEPERFVQLTAVHVREADARHQAVLDEPGERAH